MHSSMRRSMRNDLLVQISCLAAEYRGVACYNLLK